VFAGARPACAELAALGRYRWQRSKGQRYLYEVKGRVRKSLGPESAETESIKAQADARRASLEERVGGLKARLEEMAPVNRAMGLGRLPKLAARIVRELDKEDLLGEHIIVAGTNALYGYEALAGVRIGGEHVATGDADLVWDTSKQLLLAGSGIRKQGLMGLLQRIDHSFVADYGFNATNKEGYIVDLLCPENEELQSFKKEGDLVATPMAGIKWLLDAPRREAVCIGEDGLPVRLVVPEARTFALHKLWVSEREDRNPLKKKRDRAQAGLVARLAAEYFGEKMDGAMPWLPEELKDMAEKFKA
jgi:hypothetical protein